MKKITLLLLSLFVLGATSGQSLSYKNYNAGNGGTNVTATVDFLTDCQQSVSLEIYSDIYTGVWTGAGNYDYYVNDQLIGSGTAVQQTIDISAYIPVTSVKVVSKAGTWSIVEAKVIVTESSALAAGPTVADVSYCKDATAVPLEATLTGDGTSLKWYTDEAGSYSATVPTPITTASGTTSYYVAQVNTNGCESQRSVIAVDVEDAAVLTCPENVSMTTTSTQEEINTGFIDFLNSFSHTGTNTTSSFSNEITGFNALYDPANWTTPEQSPSSSFNHSSTTLAITAVHGGGGTTRQLVIPADGTISFDWSGNFTGSGGYIVAYKINGVRTDITTTTGSGSLSGIAVSAGDVFQFYTWGLTQYSTYQATISNFAVNSALPSISTTDNGFVDSSMPANWTTPEQSPSSSFNHSSTTLAITTVHGGGGTTRQLVIPADGTISFDWSGNFTGSGGYIVAYKINGVRTDITTTTGSGSLSDIAVSAGDVFQFYTWGLTQYSTYSASISNFQYQYSTKYLGAVAGFAETGGAVDVTYSVDNVCGTQTCVKTFTVGISTEVEEDFSSAYKFYPNPTSGLLTVELPEDGVVNVFDLNGKLLQSASVSMGRNTINLTELRTGVYIIKYISPNSVKTFNVIKK